MSKSTLIDRLEHLKRTNPFAENVGFRPVIPDHVLRDFGVFFGIATFVLMMISVIAFSAVNGPGVSAVPTGFWLIVGMFLFSALSCASLIMWQKSRFTHRVYQASSLKACWNTASQAKRLALDLGERGETWVRDFLNESGSLLLSRDAEDRYFALARLSARTMSGSKFREHAERGFDTRLTLDRAIDNSLWCIRTEIKKKGFQQGQRAFTRLRQNPKPADGGARESK